MIGKKRILLELLELIDTGEFTDMCKINDRARERFPDMYDWSNSLRASGQLGLDLNELYDEGYLIKARYDGEDGLRHTGYKLTVLGRIELKNRAEVNV